MYHYELLFIVILYAILSYIYCCHEERENSQTTERVWENCDFELFSMEIDVSIRSMMMEFGRTV